MLLLSLFIFNLLIFYFILIHQKTTNDVASDTNVGGMTVKPYCCLNKDTFPDDDKVSIEVSDICNSASSNRFSVNIILLQVVACALSLVLTMTLN